MFIACECVHERPVKHSQGAFTPTRKSDKIFISHLLMAFYQITAYLGFAKGKIIRPKVMARVGKERIQ